MRVSVLMLDSAAELQRALPSGFVGSGVKQRDRFIAKIAAPGLAVADNANVKHLSSVKFSRHPACAT